MSWVGGDIPGLQAMGSAMAGAEGKTSDIVRTLDQRVDALASDASWRGESQKAFKRVWSTSAAQVNAVNVTVSAAGRSIAALGNELARLENALHDAADEFKGKGVPIGANGQPQTIVVKGNPTKSPAAEVLEAAKEYKEIYDSAMMLAKTARSDTANDLSDLLGKILPSEDVEQGSEGPKKDGVVTALDFVRGILTVPNEQQDKLAEKAKELADARDRFKATRGPLQAAKAEYADNGMKLPAANDARLAHSTALKELNEAADDFARTRAPAGILPGSTWLNAKMADLAGARGAQEFLSESTKFLRDVPVLDVVATGAVAAILGKDDWDKGRNPVVAYASNALGGAGSLVLGAGAVALLPEEAGLTAAALVGGGTVALGGNVISAGIDENWMDDIHRSGVVAGVADGVGHSVTHGVTETGHQIADISKSVWHGIFG